MDADVVVVGAGIIGLINALQLAKRHLRVVLIDNIVEQKRSYKVGESLLIFSNHFLRCIGGLDEFIKDSFPKEGIWFLHGMEGAETFDNATEWAFQAKLPKRWEETLGDERKFRAFFTDAQIVRPEAEDLLRQTVRSHPNITFLDSASVKDVELEASSGLHDVAWYSRQRDERGVVRTRWVIDNSGNNRFLAKRLGHTADPDDGFQTTAVWAQFRDVSDDAFEGTWDYEFVDGGKTRRDLSTTHLWGVGYWIWVIRLSDNRISIGATFDQRYAPPGRTPREQFWNLINRYPVLRNTLTEQNLLEFRTYRNVQHLTNTFVSPRRYGMMGDAASIIDAYYSQGISLSLVTSWHVANIIEQDVHHGKLDEKYIARVNEATWFDWQMMRNMVKGKYTRAIQDSRFFFLSHMLDGVVIASISSPRFRLARWLYETEGDPQRETEDHKRFRAYLRDHLFLSRTPPWSWLTPRTVEGLQRRLQDRLVERALWRLDHGVELPPIKLFARLTWPFPHLGRLLFPKPGVANDVSMPDQVEPAWIRIKGNEVVPLPLRMAGPTMLTLFTVVYTFDVVDTWIRRLVHRITGRQAAEPVRLEPADSHATDHRLAA
jgi:2-polyprenyl-6-methoxyphenol hydroxylase-like FAD-dependent oxidoreductase